MSVCPECLSFWSCVSKHLIHIIILRTGAGRSRDHPGNSTNSYRPRWSRWWTVGTEYDAFAVGIIGSCENKVFTVGVCVTFVTFFTDNRTYVYRYIYVSSLVSHKRVCLFFGHLHSGNTQRCGETANAPSFHPNYIEKYCETYRPFEPLVPSPVLLRPFLNPCGRINSGGTTISKWNPNMGKMSSLELMQAPRLVCFHFYLFH